MAFSSFVMIIWLPASSAIPGLLSKVAKLRAPPYIDTGRTAAHLTPSLVTTCLQEAMPMYPSEAA
jgi:predicted patatin/cPLA2 family phospholipase